jgi:hypothetical protein
MIRTEAVAEIPIRFYSFHLWFLIGGSVDQIGYLSPSCHALAGKWISGPGLVGVLPALTPRLPLGCGVDVARQPACSAAWQARRQGSRRQRG